LWIYLDERPSLEQKIARHIIYDLTRLTTRFLTEAPNGIDRVDLRLAKYFAFARATEMSALMWAPIGPRLYSASIAQEVVQAIEAHWRESEQAYEDPLYEQVVQRLICPCVGEGPIEGTSGRGRKAFTAELRKYLLRWGQSARRTAPAQAAYLNVSHFPIEYAAHSRWLFLRPDILCGFFIHDLLPIDMPQYFWPKEPGRHAQRLDNIRRLGGRVIVASNSVAERLTKYFEERNYRPPILKATLPVSPVFYAPRQLDRRLSSRPYFIVCGTIEPRKNHVFLLNLWRELAKQSSEIPALVVVGKRGWNSETAVDMLERSPSLARTVVEVSGLTTPGLKRLMDNAVALLAPSIAEGFGLPIAEAAAAGLPVIASQIDPFKEFPAANVTLIDPLNGQGWLRAIRERTLNSCSDRRIAAPVGGQFEREVEHFLNTS
jgi:glycosyltransferase involved in cell wall biosynthesis